MKEIIRKFFVAGMLLTMILGFASCEGSLDDIFGEWSRPVPVSDITISDASLEMEVNDQAQLSATAYPENAKYKNITWSSSNPSVVAVDASGHVTALSKGRATITANSNGYKATCEVTVGIFLANVTANKEFTDGDILMGTLASNVKLSIAPGATITLQNASINGVNGAYNWAGITCTGDATIILKGTNVVRGFQNYYPGIFIPKDYTLTIQGDGKLTASPCNGGGGPATGAGIGGAHIPYAAGDCGNIVIKGGDITAVGGGSAAGIGAAPDYNCGNITISGGNVTAIGGSYAAGIGSALILGGSSSYGCGDITISGGVVKATGGMMGAGIGSGVGGSTALSLCGNILISGGYVEATGGDHSPGIGTGCNFSQCGTITITSGVTQVIATKGAGDPYMPSIGESHGVSVACGTITIEDPSKVIQQ
jgi:hypothetical protein